MRQRRVKRFNQLPELNVALSVEVIVFLFDLSTSPLYSFHSTAEARREKLTSATLRSI